MGKLINIVTGRLFLFIIAVLVQILILASTILWLNDYTVANVTFQLLSIAVVLYIVNKDDNPSYKLAWCILIMTLPILGGVFYLLFGNNKTGRVFQEAIENGQFSNMPVGVIDCNAQENLTKECPYAKKQSTYISNITRYHLRANTQTTYFKLGEEKMAALLTELEKAEHFIFMEYFIIESGLFWNKILDVLIRKAAQGVDVRLMYDDAGCIGTLPKGYDDFLRSKGIKVVVFNPLRLTLNIQVNHRDHKKIAVIDGYVGFNGGINLADEYINHVQKHGHWKDTAIMLKGEGVVNLTEMFLQMWCFHTKENLSLANYTPETYNAETFKGEGYVQSYSDTPLDDEAVGQTVYMSILNNAKNYVYINTPYLIIDSDMQTALTSAAKSGVEVIITLPHIPDKWYVHLIAKSHYRSLLKAGVRIFEYTPGFIHAKSFIADDEIGVIGTINLDYRSLYLHFECATWMYKTTAIKDMKEDYLETLKVSQEITLNNIKRASGVELLAQSVIKVFSPLM